MKKPVMIVTGASSGIGAAAARRMALDGFRLTLAARREDRLRSVAEEVQQLGGEALVVPTDVTKPANLDAMVQSTIDRWGRVDILFNNAGVNYDRPLTKMEPEKIVAEVQTNLTAAILAAQAVLPVMLEQKSGHIINNSSLNGLVATPYNPTYCATKFGIVGFSDSLRRQLKGKGIRVSVLCSGNTPSEISPFHEAHVRGAAHAPKINGLMPTSYVAGQIARTHLPSPALTDDPQTLEPIHLSGRHLPQLVRPIHQILYLKSNGMAGPSRLHRFPCLALLPTQQHISDNLFHLFFGGLPVFAAHLEQLDQPQDHHRVFPFKGVTVLFGAEAGLGMIDGHVIAHLADQRHGGHHGIFIGS